MAPNALPPFNSNAFQTRDDLVYGLTSLLDPLVSKFSPGSARLRIGTTATHYDSVASQLEGFARPLWGLASLLAGGGSYQYTEKWRQGLINGTDPSHSEYWGDVHDLDQRIVEMCPLGFALCLTPGEFWEPLTPRQRENVAKWVTQVNERTLPNTNWLWFRVFANLGLMKCGAAHSLSQIRTDMDHLDTFYVGEGWSNDGPRTHLQMDYYSSSFAIQTTQLLYSRLARDFDPERCEKYRERARKFAPQFVHYFDPEGRAIPFGRSTVYRFAMGAFWGAMAFAGVEPPAPLSWGAIKGLLLRNLRWWAGQQYIFNTGGTLNIGYTYPNAYMTENYNSAGSVYWCCLAFLPLALPATHLFWTEAEVPYPSDAILQTIALHEPKHIFSHLGAHTFLLSSGQACHYPLRATEAKYGKFAYSSAFGFSVPVGGHTLEQYAPDSTLSLSIDRGMTWISRRQSHNFRIETIDNSPVLRSEWTAFPDVHVATWLVPPVAGEAENWHLRVHILTINHSYASPAREFEICEAGFAIAGTAGDREGRYLGVFDEETGEGNVLREKGAVTVSWAGAVGIADLLPAVYEGVGMNRKAKVVKVDPMSNIVEARTLMPSLRSRIGGEETGMGRGAGRYVFVTGVYAIPASAEGWKERWRAGWEKKPVVPGWVEGIIRAVGDEAEEEERESDSR
jgi:hypothetical protein